MQYSLIVIFWMGANPDVYWNNDTYLFDSMNDCEQHKAAIIAETEHNHPRFTVKGGCTTAHPLIHETTLKEIPSEGQPDDNAPAH